MPSSYRKVNYRLRTAKHIERKMMVEVLHRINRTFALDQYRYVGMGSVFFADFMLFHKSLGISKMTSIEKDIGAKPRFDWNKPYGFIDMLYELSSTALMKVDWTEPLILWLDYDGPLDTDVLEDIRIFATSAASLSILFVTVNAESFPSTLKDFEFQLGTEAASPFLPKDILPGAFPKTCSIAIRNQIASSLSTRNGGTPLGERINTVPLLTFEYDDGTRMLTLGQLFGSQNHSDEIAKLNLSDLPFVTGELIYNIAPPILTHREMRYLDRMLPNVDEGHIGEKNIPVSDAKRYCQLYRYFPIFADVDL